MIAERERVSACAGNARVHSQAWGLSRLQLGPTTSAAVSGIRRPWMEGEGRGATVQPPHQVTAGTGTERVYAVWCRVSRGRMRGGREGRVRDRDNGVIGCTRREGEAC